MRGNLDELRRLRRNGCPWDENTFTHAVHWGDPATLEWLYSQNCPWDENACQQAARDGNLDSLVWLREKGCSWDSSTCAYAAWNGHLDVLRWARENGCPWSVDTCSYASTAEQYGALEWAISEGCDYRSSEWSPKTVRAMANAGIFATGRCLARMCDYKNSECGGLCSVHLSRVVAVLLEASPALCADTALLIADM